MSHISIDQAKFIDELRASAKTSPAVHALLVTLRDCVLIDGAGNREIYEESVATITAAQIAASFSEVDYGGGV